MWIESDATRIQTVLHALDASVDYFARLGLRFPRQPDRSYFERLEQAAALQASHVQRAVISSNPVVEDPTFHAQALFSAPEWFHAQSLDTDALLHIALSCEHQLFTTCLNYAGKSGPSRRLLRSLADGSLMRHQVIENTFEQRLALFAPQVTLEDVLGKVLRAEYMVARFYRALSRDVTPSINRYLLGMADVEELHGAQVAGVLRESFPADRVDGANTVSLRALTSPAWLSGRAMTMSDALSLTNDVCRRMASYYLWLSGYLEDDDREMVVGFADTEAGHGALIRSYLGEDELPLAV